MDWTILGIEPTQDKKAITAAYRARLKLTNPEDKPEEFKNLRAAYEEALKLADTPVTRDESPLGRWMERVAALYADFSARIRPENWRALLDDDVCTALDTRPAAEDGLLKFLMERYFLPQAVWQVLDEAFGFSRRVEELYESYPREFIDHAVMSGIRHPDGLPYDLFQPGRNASDCDTYRRLYYQANQTLPEEAAPLLEQLEALSEWHPYGQALRCRWWRFTGERDKAGEGFRTLARDYPGDAALNNAWASFCLEEGDQAEAEAVSRRVLDRNPGDMAAGRNLADCLAARGAYDEAKELCYGLMHACGGDPILMEQLAAKLRVWNEALIEQRKAVLDRDPGDSGNAIELAWCYSQNERLEEAMEVARAIDPECDDQFSYHNLMGKLHHNRQEFDAALDHMRTVEQILRAMKPDGTAETEKRLRRLPEMLQIQGNCLMQLGQTEQAREKFEQAPALAPEDPETLTVMGKILFAAGDYERSAEILERLSRVSPESWHGNVLLSLALYRLRRDRDAFDAINRALAVQGGDLSAYVLKMQILLRNGVFEEVHAILDFLKDCGAPADISIDYVQAQLVQLEEKDEKKAFKLYQALARRVEGGEDMFWAAQLYYQMAVLMGNTMDADREADREVLLAVLEKGLAAEKEDPDCLAYKAWLLKQGGKLSEAIDMYKALMEKPGHASTVEESLAQLYYEDLSRYAREALECYEKLLRKRQTPELYFYAGNCLRQMGEEEKALACFRRELELDPEDMDGWHSLSGIFESRGEYGQALEYADRALDIMADGERTYPFLIDHKLQILRRMGDHQQALAFADEAMTKFDHPGLWQMKFDICCQFGLWDRAEQVLAGWKKARPGDVAQIKATGRLHLLMGRMFRAAVTMGTIKRRMDMEEELDLRLQLADLECNHKRQVQIWSRRVRQDPDSDYGWLSLAQACRRAGDTAGAAKAAEKALALLDEILELDLTDEALFRSRRSLALALLGREDEARAELANVRQLPLCHHCEYGSCKDADIFAAAMEEIFGSTEKARALYREGREKWPDELDFAAGEARMKKKGK